MVDIVTDRSMAGISMAGPRSIPTTRTLSGSDPPNQMIRQAFCMTDIVHTPTATIVVGPPVGR